MEEHTWTVDDVLGGDDETTIEENIDALRDELTDYEDRLDDISADGLHEFLTTYEELQEVLSAINAYYSLRFAENTGDTEVLAKQKQLSQQRAEISNDLLFFFDWFKHLDQEQARRYIGSEELSNYAYYLEKLRSKAQYTRSREVEEALTIKDVATSNLSDLYDTITNDFTYEFQGEEITEEELKTYMLSTDPEERRSSYDVLLGTYEDHATPLTEVYTMIANDWRNEATKIRGYEESIAVRSTGQDIDTDAVHTLMETVRDNRGIFQDYFDVKHDILRDLGQDVENNRVHAYAPLSEEQKEYGFDEAKQLVLSTFKAFDSRFYNAAKEIFDADHVDSHPREKKQSGAFCLDAPRDIPPYVMTNYDGTQNDVLTLAHELGHGIHDVLIKDQTKVNRHPVIPMAETASVFAEMLVMDRLQESITTSEQNIALLGRFLDDQFATVLRQVYFTEFERQAHEALGDGASQDDLNDIYYELLQEQFGNMEIPRIFKREWNRVPHIHHSPFYCYAYAWGNLLVLSLYDVYQDRGDDFIDDYIDMLSAGKSESPDDLLGRFGFNPSNRSFWERGLQVVERRLDDLKDAHNDFNGR